MTLKEEFVEKMLAEKLDFLPLEDALQLNASSEAVETKMNYIAYTEEVEDGYYCELEDLFKELDEVCGIYDTEGNFKIDGYTLRIGIGEDSFERILCPAPTYVDLIR